MEKITLIFKHESRDGVNVLNDLPENIRKVLLKIASILSSKRIKWVLVGSTASHLHGLNIVPKDIDILVELKRVYEVDELLASRLNIIRRVKQSSDRLYSSHYGVFEAHNVKVEVMADLKMRREYGVLKLDFDEIYSFSKEIKVNGVCIRVIPLEWQLVANLMIPGKERRVKAILTLLKVKGIEREVLDSVLRHASVDVKDIVLKLLRSSNLLRTEFNTLP